MFGGQRGTCNSRSRRKTKTIKTGTWTTTFVCLANKGQAKVPSVTEKQILFKAGLGCKKIQMSILDKEEELLTKLKNEYPKLKYAGGVELLNCTGSCRELSIIDCRWAVEDLKRCLGTQAKVYLRPIQSNLCTKSVLPDITSLGVKQKCNRCQSEFYLRELRKHIRECTSFPDMSSDSDHSDEDLTVVEPVSNVHVLEANEIVSDLQAEGTNEHVTDLPIEITNHERVTVTDLQTENTNDEIDTDLLQTVDDNSIDNGK